MPELIKDFNDCKSVSHGIFSHGKIESVMKFPLNYPKST